MKGACALPPTSLTESVGIHLSHVAHADDADGDRLHLWMLNACHDEEYRAFL